MLEGRESQLEKCLLKDGRSAAFRGLNILRSRLNKQQQLVQYGLIYIRVILGLFPDAQHHQSHISEIIVVLH